MKFLSEFLSIFQNLQAKWYFLIFSQLSLLQIWRHITFICISKWLPPSHKFLHFECKYLENQRWYWKTVNGVFPVLSNLTSETNMLFGWIFSLTQLLKLLILRLKHSARGWGLEETFQKPFPTGKWIVCLSLRENAQDCFCLILWQF